MNMRDKGCIWWMWLLLFLFSCTESEQTVEPVNPGEVRMSMNISTRATSDPEVLNTNETRISRLRIYVFDGTSLDKMYYWQGLTATDGTYTTPVFKVKAATGKTLYTIVNEPVDLNTRAILESVDHPNDLVDVQYQMADYLTTKTNVVEYGKEYCLPMYGELAGVDAAEGTTQTVNMHVDRAVARVDVYMRKESGNREEVQIPAMLVVTGVSKTGFISPEKTGNYASSAINMLSRKTVGEIPEETSPEDKGVLAYSFYIPEMECKDSKLNIGIDEYDMIELGGDANNSGGAPLEKLERNHVYQLLCRFMIKSLSLEMHILDWEDVGVTGDIVGTDFYIDRTVGKGITLIKDIVDPVKLVKVDCRTPGRLRIRTLKPDKADLMSTSDLQLYCNGITETDKLADNSGIYDLTAAQVMNFYCTTGSVPTNYEGGFIEVSSDNVHVEYIPISSLDTFTPLDTEGTANSYIADRGAGSYSFTATIMGNGSDGIIDEGKFEDAMGNILTKAAGADIHPLSAKLLWQDTDELVEQVALVNNRVQVKMGRSRGNALIAVYDKADPNAEDAKVLWSWHLWCTAVPQIIEFIVPKTGNKYKMMDRNLGATTITPALWTTQGLHYQWGRKDPFNSPLKNDGKLTTLYNVRSVGSLWKITHEEPLTLAQAINNPDIFIHRTWSDDTWCTKTSDSETTEMRYVWGNPEGTIADYPSSTIKTIYDPCPVGYKISPFDAFFIFNESGVNMNGVTAYVEDKMIFLPITCTPDWAFSPAISGTYWSSSVYGRRSDDFYWQKMGALLYFYPKGTGINKLNTTLWLGFVQAGSIRCVKE